MNKSKLLTFVCVVSLNVVFAQKKSENDSDPPRLKGPYLGQKPPGTTPEPFAPGIVSTAHKDLSGFFSPDMTEFYFTRYNDSIKKFSLIGFQNIDNQWIESFVAPRVGRPIFAPDGNSMHLGSKYMERTMDGWSEVKSLGPMFDREDWGIMRLSSSASGTYVFDDFKNNDVIRISTIENGKREEPRLLGKEINSGKYTAHPFIAPDESYLIWDSERDDGYGDSDLYISFRQEDGSWGAAINLGDKINTGAWEASAFVTSDGKYLFFNRSVGQESADIFWVDAQIIETLRPKHTSYTIAYGSIDSGSVEIYSGDTEGKPTIKSINAPGGYLAWSPDGKQLAFYHKYDDKKTWSIHTMNIDGTNRKRLTHARNKWDSAPAWSPDGKKIAFGRTYKNSEEVWQNEIWMMNSDGSEQTRIKSLNGGGPFFTPNGRIVFYSDYINGKSEICIANEDGTNLIKLTDNEVHDWHPDVSPDGTQITYMSKIDGNFEIYIMNIDGSDQRRLTNNDVDNWYPSWSPDGSKIIFSSVKDSEKQKKDIYVMNKDGSGVKKIISQSGYAVFKR